MAYLQTLWNRTIESHPYDTMQILRLALAVSIMQLYHHIVILGCVRCYHGSLEVIAIEASVFPSDYSSIFIYFIVWIFANYSKSHSIYL